MTKKLLLLFCAGIGLASCGNMKKTENPLLQEYATPFQTPDFNKIKLEHYKPAYIEAMAINKAEIDQIANNTEAPTFDNTILALNNSGKLLSQVEDAFDCIQNNMINDTVQGISKEITPLLTAHYDEISLNDKLFGRIKTLYDDRANQNLDSLQLRTLEKYYDDYVRNGAALTAEQKESMKQINSKLAMATLKYGENVLKETNSFKLVIDNEADLSGLPESVIAAAASDAKEAGMEGKWVFTTDKPSMLPFLQYSDKKELRKKLYDAYYNRANNNNEYDNKKIINEIVTLRTQKAQLLGYKNYADYVVSNNMAKEPKNVYNLLLQLWNPGVKQAKVELAELQKFADKEGKGVKVEGADWWYYSEKLRKERFNLDEEQLKPYLKLDNVRDGMFYVANKLYGITFEKLTNIPVYHPYVETFEVKDSDGSHLAILYMDYYPRASKRGGAWCSRLRGYDWNNGKEIYPLVTISCNFSKPVGDKPALLSWDETETMFHEFGHAIHGFFTRGKYNRIAGRIPRDMIELPSQIMENWVSEPEVLKVFARHYETNEVMPDALIAKLNASSKFNQGWATSEHMAAALLDMDWYSQEGAGDKDVAAFEKEAMQKYGLIDEIYPRYRSTFFNHIFSGGYSAGYYVYTWAAVLDTDAFEAFKSTGDIYNQEVAKKFRQYVLSEGGYDEGMVQYLKFRGAEPSVEPLLKKRGFVN